jgi:hypothetical protein
MLSLLRLSALSLPPVELPPLLLRGIFLSYFVKDLTITIFIFTNIFSIGVSSFAVFSVGRGGGVDFCR